MNCRFKKILIQLFYHSHSFKRKITTSDPQKSPLAFRTTLLHSFLYFPELNSNLVEIQNHSNHIITITRTTETINPISLLCLHNANYKLHETPVYAR